MERQQREFVRKQKERSKAVREATRQIEREQYQKWKEEKRVLKSEKQMLAQQRRGQGQLSINVRASSPLRIVIRKAKVTDCLVPSVVPKDKEYEYNCADCGFTRMVKGTKPKAGWSCADGGYKCKRRYTCKHCPRTFYKEGDRSEKWECKDVGKGCLRRYKCKNCPRIFFKEGDPSDEYECKDVCKGCIMPVKKKWIE